MLLSAKKISLIPPAPVVTIFQEVPPLVVRKICPLPHATNPKLLPTKNILRNATVTPLDMVCQVLPPLVDLLKIPLLPITYPLFKSLNQISLLPEPTPKLC